MTSRTLRLSEPGRVAAVVEAGAGEPLLLVHGVGMCAEAWRPQMEALAATRRVIAVDMPGHGGSSLLAPGARLPDFVAWLAEVVDRLGLGPVDLAGHSMGALIAAGFAVEHPELTRRVALLNGVHRRTPEARAAVLARAAAIARGDDDREAPLERWFDAGEADAPARALAARWLSAVDRAGYASAYRAFAEGDAVYADRLGEIACPLLALTGEGDQNSTPAMARAMAAAARRGVARIVEGHRHMVNLTAPAVVTAALRDWLAMAPAVRSEETAP